jgi:glycosyltransferase involved in cell wall biosynthesis
MRGNLRITFVLPFAGTYPCGGFKVVYEYANRLSRKGHSVTVVHSALSRADLPWIRHARALIHYVQHSLDGKYRPDKWFKIDPGVNLAWVPSLAERYISDTDVIVATSWETAEIVANYTRTKGRLFYLIQGLEIWYGRQERVYATWKMPFRKIVISEWLREIATGLGETAILIPNGLDFQQFGVDKMPQDRNGVQCMMSYSPIVWKGSVDGLEALSIVKKEVPDLRAILFGVTNPPSHLPDWIEYYRRPEQVTLRGLYNQASIFIAPSWSEGWGLTPSEALMCGAAVVATDVGGHREFAFHEQTALVNPPKNPSLLAANIVRLIREPELRIALAKQGNTYIQRFTWEKSVDNFEAALMQGKK